MSGSIPIQIRGTPSNGPPVGLVERQLAVEMNNGNLWVGVPVSIDSTGRIMLNPRRVPAGGAQFEVLTKATGTSFGWAAPGDVGGNNTAIGASALGMAGSANLSNNLALGWGALQLIGASANVSAGNVGIGDRAGGFFGPQGAPTSMTTANNGVYLGARTQALANAQTNEVVIGANTTGHGSNTATIGADSGPNAMTQFWVGGRDLLAIGEPPAFGTAHAAISGANNGTVVDGASGVLDAGLWIVICRVWMSTSTATPWISYTAGLNTALGQSTIVDSSNWSTTTGSIYSASFMHTNIFRLIAPTLIVGCVAAANATNSGTFTGTVDVEPFQLA